MADGEDVKDLVPEDSRIRLLHLGGGDPLSIGEKRNFGCERARGSVICTWDDDDYSAPHRIQNQVLRLMVSGRAVTGYKSMRFTDGAQWWLYQGAPNYALGTSLCYQKGWWIDHRFPALQVAEDNRFVEMAAAAGQLTTVDACELMYATNHAGNTSPRNMGTAWKRL